MFIKVACLFSRSSGPIVTALWIAADSSRTFDGWNLTLASLVNEDAPANSDSTSTPCRLAWQAMYSNETRFIPSRADVRRQTSATEYRAESSSKGTERCM